MGWFGPPTWGEQIDQADRRRKRREREAAARDRRRRVDAIRHPVRHQLRRWGLR